MYVVIAVAFVLGGIFLGAGLYLIWRGDFPAWVQVLMPCQLRSTDHSAARPEICRRSSDRSCSLSHGLWVMRVRGREPRSPLAAALDTQAVLPDVPLRRRP